MVPKRRRRATVDGDARKLILDAAEKLIAASGFDATSTTVVAESAGVPKGLVFYYFPTKEAILRALLTERLPTEPLTDIAAVVTPGDPAASLLNLDAALNLRQHRSPVLRVILWREAETHPDVRDRLRGLRAHLIDTTVRVLAASAPNSVAPGTLRACATAWVAAMLSLANRDRWHALDGLPPVDDLHGVANVVAAAMTQLG